MRIENLLATYYYGRHMGIGMENVCCLIRILMFDMCNTAPSAELLSVEL